MGRKDSKRQDLLEMPVKTAEMVTKALAWSTLSGSLDKSIVLPPESILTKRKLVPSVIARNSVGKETTQ